MRCIISLFKHDVLIYSEIVIPSAFARRRISLSSFHVRGVGACPDRRYFHTSECIRGMTNTHPVPFFATTFRRKIKNYLISWYLQYKKARHHAIFFTQVLKWCLLFFYYFYLILRFFSYRLRYIYAK